MRTQFIWSGYWGVWSRILATNFEGWQTVEVNLTPVNGDRGDWDKDVRPIVIRKHCTARGRNDEIVSRLPDVWWRLIGERVGGDIRHRLVTEDFMPQIDWERYERNCNGGCALADCIKPVALAA